MRLIIAMIAVLISPLASNCDAATKRSHAARSQFQRMSRCPATGKTHGACPGYVVDHINPLCAGGADVPSNMQWQTAAAAKVKDREERHQCARR